MREFLVGGIVVGRRLMNTHRIREGATEEVVVSTSDSAEDIGEVLFLDDGHVREPGEVSPGEDHGFEGPCRPEGN